MEPEFQPTLNQGEQASPWVEAPADSHVSRFKMYDRSGSEYGASSEILVEFKSTGKSYKPPQCYRYKISNHDQAKGIFSALCGSANPGIVVSSMLVKPRVPYEGPFTAPE